MTQPQQQPESDSPVTQFVNWATKSHRTHPFYCYEPWDGPDGEEPYHTPGGGRFQLSCLRSTKYMRMSLAGNQVGKTIDRAMEVVIMSTGELPYCFRYAEGENTGIKRQVSKENIIRFGRHSVNTGKVIDHNFEAIEDETWDCGEIIGVGPYPESKICRSGNDQIWVCTYKQARDDRWIDLFKQVIPEHCLDKTQGTNGYSKSDCIFYLNDGMSIRLKTYDQGWERVEARKVWHVVLDEEPPDRRYYTGVLLHALSVSLAYTPLRGMSWTFTDIYEPFLNGSEDIDVFHATKYDCPYILKSDIERESRLLKAWERDAKIFGKFSQQENKPYYDYELCKKYIEEFEPRFKLARIIPITECRDVREVVKTAIAKRPTDEMAPDVWEIYEDKRPNEAYWAGIDCAKGSDDPEKAQDMSCCYIFRKPHTDENPEWPVCVACLYSPELTENFAWLVLYGAVYYNKSLLVPETKGEDGRAFHIELRDYPHWFEMIVISQKTRKPTKKIGFDTSCGTRTPLFNKLRKYINAHEEKSDIPHRQLLFEQSEIIYLKGRPDHPLNGKSDCVVAWCLGLWVWEEARQMIRCNSTDVPEDDLNHLAILRLTKRAGYETKPILGSGSGMDARRREQWLQKRSLSQKQELQNRKAGLTRPHARSGTY